MSYVLELYLAEVERGLQRLPRGRRRLFLRELETHLLDEAEARDLCDDEGMKALLSEKEPPEHIAAEIATHDEGETTLRSGIALLSGSLIGLAAGANFWLHEWPWYICVGWYVAFGLAVGTSMFVLRRHWQRLPAGLRLVLAVILGTLLAIPLGFAGNHGFRTWRILYGSFLGYMVERHAVRRPVWQLVLDTLIYTAIYIFLDLKFLHPWKHFEWWWLSNLIGLNFSLSFAVLGAMSLKRYLSERWVLTVSRDH